MASESLFWERWIRNTIRKVTMVVPVLITSCHVSEKWKIGPVTIQTRITSTASPNAHELPDQSVTAREALSSHLPIDDFDLRPLCAFPFISNPPDGLVARWRSG